MSLNSPIMPCGNYYGLPEMFTRTEQMMMPFVQDYANSVSQMDFENEFVIPARTYSYTSGASGTGTGGSVFNMDEHLEKLRENQQKMREYNMQRQIQERQYARAQLAPLVRSKIAATDLERKIVENEQDQIMAELENYKDSIRAAYYGDMTEEVFNQKIAEEPGFKEEFMATVRDHYSQDSQGHIDLADEINANGHSSFLQGFINGATLGIFGQRTTDETISEITGQEVSTSSRNSKKAGKTAGGAVTGAAVGAGIGSIVPGVGTGVGAVVGGIVGGLIGLFS